MEANVTLLWFVVPKWFHDLGAFSKASNISLFVEWAKLAFSHFGAAPVLQCCSRLHHLMVHTMAAH
jgi:beta-glucosidase/6-phospho-beta-glucosidase/beta-galactosidase